MMLATWGDVVWIAKLLRSLSHDLDSGLTRIRGKTLGKAPPAKSPRAPAIGKGEVSVLRAGKVTPMVVNVAERDGSADD